MSSSPLPFQTLRQTAQINGIGLHSGTQVTASLQPRATCGVVFARIDLAGSPEIPVALRYISGTTHATTLAANGAQVSTTEHLLAALWALGVTHCRIELDGPEVPILDGSASGWCQLIEMAGLAAVERGDNSAVDLGRPRYRLHEPIWVTDADGSMLGLPCSELRVTVVVDYGLEYAGQQAVDVVVTPQSFSRELAAARTFTLAQWIAPLQAQGLIKGGSIENAVVLGREAPSSPPRCLNELARHKALDVVGDIALLFGEAGGALQAHLIAIRAGHSLHRRWMDECLRHSALTQSV